VDEPGPQKNPPLHGPTTALKPVVLQNDPASHTVGVLMPLASQ